jgi:hypothetical protein
MNLAQMGGRKKHTFFILLQMGYTQNELILFGANGRCPKRKNRKKNGKVIFFGQIFKIG